MDRLEDMATLFKMFGDVTRLSIMAALFERELCVSDIAEKLNSSQSAVSHQLNTLKAAHLVKSRREGKNIYYSLDDDHVTSIMEMGMQHVKETNH